MYLLNGTGKHRNLFDHIESYGTSNGTIIIITSPYMENPPQHEAFVPIYKMYHGMATTYMQITSKQEIMAINKQRRIAARTFI